MSRRPLFVANWKMYKTGHEAVAYVRELGAAIQGMNDLDVVVAPPFTALAAAADAAKGSAIAIAAQNIYFEAEGAFTGEISAGMIKAAGATLAIIGHSERRRMFGDTDTSVNRKTHAALAAGLTPVVCIGETGEEREQGQTFAVLDRQMSLGLERVNAAQMASLVIAYEPVWAIGTGRNATTEEAREAHAHIRARVRDRWNASAARDCRLLYGGSVKPDNIHDMVALEDVDGALIGGASLKVESFLQILTRSKG